MVKQTTLVIPGEAFRPASNLIDQLHQMHKCSIASPMTIGLMADDFWDGDGKLARIIELDNESFVLRLGTGEKCGLSAQDVPPEVAAEVRRLCDELKVGDQVLLDEHGIRLAPDLRQRVSRHAVAFPPVPLMELEQLLRQVTRSTHTWTLYCGTCFEPLSVLRGECFCSCADPNTEQ